MVEQRSAQASRWPAYTGHVDPRGRDHGLTGRRWFRVGYVLMFCVALPVALILWARRLDILLVLPGVPWPAPGIALAVSGLLLAAWATHAFWKHGKGLPASPFPPERLVIEGPYRFLDHPIYLGAVAVSLGVSLAAGSGAGLWIVTPALAASAFAWVVGYEREATRARYQRIEAPSRVVASLAAAARPLFAVWRTLLRLSERVANSSREATIGGVRFFGHGVYAGVGAALGVGLQLALTGVGLGPWALGIAAAAIAGAGIWAQVVEGSPQLLRPYGYFGSIIGVALAVAVAAFHGVDAWLLFVSFGIGSTVTYAAGRIRCLVQGCCHGKPTRASLGIVYSHPRSRVVRLSSFAGVPLHPTQLYSLLWSLVTGALMLRLWFAEAPLPFIAGSYFILMGLGRFVEEHLRGEPQTVLVGGLRLYQWLAIASVVAGAVLTSIAGPAAPPAAGIDGRAAPWMLAAAVVAYFAYGVDFPGSARRFSRLA